MFLDSGWRLGTSEGKDDAVPALVCRGVHRAHQLLLAVLSDSFMEIEFTYRDVDLFKIYSSMVLLYSQSDCIRVIQRNRTNRRCVRVFR